MILVKTWCLLIIKQNCFLVFNTQLRQNQQFSYQSDETLVATDVADVRLRSLIKRRRFRIIVLQSALVPFKCISQKWLGEDRQLWTSDLQRSTFLPHCSQDHVLFSYISSSSDFFTLLTWVLIYFFSIMFHDPRLSASHKAVL